MKKNRQPFYNITRNADEAVIHIFTYIGRWYDEVHYEGFQEQFRELEESYSTITIRINSGGGEVMQGFPMYDLIATSKAKVVGIVEGIAASMAGVILQACHVRKATEHSRVMIHKVQGYCSGGL